MCREAYLCNLLTEMFRPRFEDPVDSAQDVADRNITVYEHQYYYQHLKNDLLSINSSEWTHIAETMISVKDWDERDFFTEHNMHGNGTHAFFSSHLYNRDLSIAPAEKWWRSSERMPGQTYAGYLSAKKWILNEVNFVILIPSPFNNFQELALHLLRFQQVRFHKPLCYIINSFHKRPV